MDTNQSLRDRLAEIDAQIALLQTEREIIQKHLQSVTYPVLSLPFDVTSEIFTLCLPDLEHAESIFNSKSLCRRYLLPTVLLLSQICRVWRAIASKTSKLWAIFRLVADAWPEDHALGALRLVEWTTRAGSSPLSFVFGHKERYPDRIRALPAILALILALSHQWQHVDLSLNPHEDLISEQFQSALHGRLPSLETLQITSTSPTRPWIMTTAFEVAPSLRRVVLNGIQPRMILLPWKQLTYVSTDSVYFTDCMHILQFAVSLVECKFGHINGFTDQPGHPSDHSDPLCHSDLKVFRLKGCDECGGIFGLTTLPSLAELVLDDTDVDASEHYQQFVDLLSRFRPPLLRLPPWRCVSAHTARLPISDRPHLSRDFPLDCG
ncbi:F-box domain-containing protein [Mycena sanguinolenta]|uniref:F-box domain-containing protein n=1 Tax=Mycena sanguinolenta TaxID=230812 RepID=A0A8H6YA54_9AGAR|nr:F-box domain-containing protein [Mycena sanguinolenta]